MELDNTPAADIPPAADVAQSHAARWRTKPALLALAASLLVAAGLGWLTYSGWSDHHGHHQLAAGFTQYLDRFHEAPDAAQDMLVKMYGGRAVDSDQAVQLVGYHPVTAKGLPQGYQSEGTYVLKMPCCTCVQTVCRRPDGSTVAIFEHDDESREWLADRNRSLGRHARRRRIDCGLGRAIEIPDAHMRQRRGRPSHKRLAECFAPK